jgi:hypothetical protein
VNATTTLRRVESVVDATGQAPVIEARLPGGGRPRQLSVRTLLVGALLAVTDDRPLQLVRVHQSLLALADDDRRRLGIEVAWRGGPHVLTYRQVERTFSLVVAQMDPSPVPSFAGVSVEERSIRLAEARAACVSGADARLCSFVDALCEASIPAEWKTCTTSYSVDWTDHAAWSRAVPADSIELAADPDAGWGHRKSHFPGDRDQLFFGFYVQAVVMAPEEGGPKVPELVRRVSLEKPKIDPPTQMAGMLGAMARSAIVVGDVLADSGYSHRSAERWATPLRLIGARPVHDLHPHDRGQKGAFEGAVCASGSLYCPATPKPLLALGPPPRGASALSIADHDEQTTELARWRLVRVTADDVDGYHRCACPATQGRLRCPLKARSMTLGFDRPEVTDPPTVPPRCCAQATITVPPSVNAKTRQKHPYPSIEHRKSYARRTGAERAFSTLKDPSSTDVRRGSCRMMGRTKNIVLFTVAVIVRNMRILDSFEASRADEDHRAAAGLSPRRRRRSSITELPVHDDVTIRQVLSDTA